MARKQARPSPKRRELRYPKDLLEPLRIPKFEKRSGSTIYSGPELLRDSWLDNERKRKLELLLRHYGLEPKSYADALRLVQLVAIDWVPGFSTSESTRGARPKYFNDAYLVAKVADYRTQNPKWSIPKALEHFKAEHKGIPEWRNLPSVASFRNIYDGARKRELARQQQRARKYAEALTSGALTIGKLLAGKGTHKK